MKGKQFFDTNILYYAYDASEPEKRKACQALVGNVFDGKSAGVVSNQVLGELFNALVTKLSVPEGEARLIVDALIISDKWIKINYTESTIKSAVKDFGILKTPFWDLVIAETMKENDISEIITENEKDFRKVPGINVTNPFNKL